MELEGPPGDAGDGITVVRASLEEPVMTTGVGASEDGPPALE